MQLIKSQSSNVHNIMTVLGFHDTDISKELRERVNWDKVFSTIETYKSSYNQNMMRFVKSHLISKAIQRFSNNYLKYVDRTGYDFVTQDQQQYKIELKSGIKMFQRRAKKTVDITISNTQGQSTDTKPFEKTFDYLLLIEPTAVAVTTWEKMRPYIRACGDSYKAKISFIDLEFLVKVDSTLDFKIDLSDRMEEAFERCLDDIEEGFKNYQKKKE